MKHIVLIVLLFASLLAPLSVPAQQNITTHEAAASAFQQANDLYKNGQYAAALDAYRRIARSGFPTREVYANAGNAAWQAGDVGQAVLMYERALAIDPSYDLARQNLERVQPETNKGTETNALHVIVEWFRSTSEGWWLFFAFATFLWFAATLAYTARTPGGTERRAGWWARTAGAAGVWIVASLLLIGHGTLTQPGDDEAVIISDRVQSRLGPGEKFLPQLELPAGTLVQLLGPPEEGWVKFMLRDGRSGYIETRSVERI